MRIRNIIVLFILLGELSISYETNGDFLNNVIIVDDEGDGDYTNIQQAIDNANEGDLIKVYSGFYEGNIKINKKIILSGVPEELGKGNDTGKPVIESDNIVVTVVANNVNISGFIIQNGKTGLKILSDYNHVEGNIFRNCEIGVYLIMANNNAVINNEIINSSLYGVYLRAHSNHNVICRNNLSMNNANIFVTFSHNNIILENRINFAKFGILIGYSRGNTISLNFISNQDFGVLLDGVIDSIISNNNFIENNIHALFAEFSLFNRWNGNYWDNWHLKAPKPIFGVVLPLIPWIDFDWHPATQPWNI